MKHTDQKTLSLAALTLSALLLAGCGNGSTGGAENTGGAEPTTAAEPTGTPAEPTGTEDATAGGSPSASPTDGATAGESPSGTATAGESASPTSTGTSSASPGTGSEAAAVAGAVVAAEEAVTGGQAFEIDRKDGEGGWEVKLAVGDREKEVDVSEDGSEVTPQDGDDQLDQEDRELIAQVQVSLEEAVRTALNEVDGTLDGAQLDTEDGTTVWEVDIDDTEGTSVDVYVNVDNGSVVKVDR
ncbi:PepSY domain-containing protein [Kocuria sp. CPCC 205300]|uniref:PepSY domain-containing protein n=1 Tax=Kocuria sabuli TaxID=3071448 RepID=UPI0036DBC100